MSAWRKSYRSTRRSGYQDEQRIKGVRRQQKWESGLGPWIEHGLIRKYYLLSEDGKTAGGVYLWKSREDAEQLYTDDWKRFIVEKYGSEPSVHYFATPVVVDNLSGEIIADD